MNEMRINTVNKVAMLLEMVIKGMFAVIAILKTIL